MKKQSILFIFLVSILLFSACGGEKTAEEKFVRPVKYQEVGFQGNGKLRSFSGTAQTDMVIDLSFRSTGIITQFDIKLGQQVKKGQQLARLDNVQSRLAYEQALTQLNSAESQMNTAKLSLNRVRALYEKGSSSLSDFESAKNAFRTAQESYESAKRGVDIQKEQVRYGYLYAPENGVIASVMGEIDENVNPGQPVATLNSGRNMEITIGIPESVINGVKRDMEVAVKFPSLQGKAYKGKVTEVAPALDANSSTYPVRVTIYQPDDEIKSGMAADVTFDFGGAPRTQKALVIPAHAVGEDSKGRFVFVVEGDGANARVKKQHITIGALGSDGFEVTAGLTAGQKIATAGLQTLLDGQEVSIN